MEPALLIPLGVFAMLVAFSYLETRKDIANREALSREYLAAIDKGLHGRSDLPIRPMHSRRLLFANQ